MQLLGETNTFIFVFVSLFYLLKKRTQYKKGAFKMATELSKNRLKLKIHWSIYLLVGFVTFSLATGFFPFALPGETAGFYISAALLAAGGILGSLLMYELTPALVARKLGYRVEGIELSFFGQKHFEKEEPTIARHDFWINFSKVLTSAGLAATGFGLAWLFAPIQSGVSLLLIYLGGLNLLLTAFNLLPAPPLPGGKILRSLVWGATKNQDKAERVYTNAGRVTGWFVLIAGATVMFTLSITDGLIIALAGWLLLMNSRVAKYQYLTTTGLKGVTAEQVTINDGAFVHPQMPLKEVLPLLWQKEPGRVLPVLDNGYFQGVLNLQTVQLQVKQPQTISLLVADVMTRRGGLLVVRPQTPMTEVVKEMSAKVQPFAVVLDDWGYFKGIVYVQDLPRYIEMSRYLQYTMPNPMPIEVIEPGKVEIIPPANSEAEKREEAGIR
jgi:Zn-dependent protease/CBS domain-containing protein